MKTLQRYITEKILINKNSKLPYNYYPKTKEELKDIINQRIKSEGNECDLNDIDTSNITDMSYLFVESDFNGDISNWNVSNVESMISMFAGSNFNGDISKWDVSNIESMNGMFAGSNFNGNISNWNVSNVTNMGDMFVWSKFNNDIFCPETYRIDTKVLPDYIQKAYNNMGYLDYEQTFELTTLSYKDLRKKIYSDISKLSKEEKMECINELDTVKFKVDVAFSLAVSGPSANAGTAIINASATGSNFTIFFIG